MHKYLSDTLPRGTGVNFVAHSMGGLDVRHLISTIKPQSYTPVSLTTIGTPHHGSPFMDWCAANIGVGTPTSAANKAVMEVTRKLPFSLKSPLLARTEEALAAGAGLAGFTSAMSRYLLNIFDSPAYSNLTTTFLREFNPQTPDDPNVKYTSVAGRTSKLSVLHPLWFPKLVLDAAAEKGYPPDDSGDKYEGNDGLVSVKSAKWGEFIGAVDDTHHWDLRGEGGIWPNGLATEEVKDKLTAKETKKENDGLILPGAWDWADDVEEYLGLNLLKSADKKPETKSKGDAKKKDDGGWEIAQVGQLLDWVTDVLPGSKTTEAGKRQIQEARDERMEAQTRGKEEKKKRDKFDLAKFYGGLMLKLREDGF
jgi:triacylglycerol lipase